MIKEGIDMFITGEEWDKARHVTQNIAPRYLGIYCKINMISLYYRFEQYVEQAYIEFLKQKNRPEEVHYLVYNNYYIVNIY